MIIIKEITSEKDYLDAYSIHYNTYKWTMFRPFLGILLIILGLGLIFVERHLFGVLCIVYSTYFFFAKRIYIQRLLKNTKQNKAFGKPSKFEIDNDGKISITVDEDYATTSIKNLLYYVDKSGYLLLYPQRNFFYFFKDEDLEKAGGKSKLLELLEKYQIMRKKI